MLTVGQSFLGHIRPMITGYDRMPLSPADAAIFAAEARGHDKG